MPLETARAWLAAHAPELRLIEQAASTATVAEAATTLGVEPARIANFKVPKAIFVAPELPRNAMGKVQKNLLRQQHAALFD